MTALAVLVDRVRACDAVWLDGDDEAAWYVRAVLADPVQVIAALAEQRVVVTTCNKEGNSPMPCASENCDCKRPLGFAGVLALLLEATTECEVCTDADMGEAMEYAAAGCPNGCDAGRVPLVDSQEVIDAMIRAGVLRVVCQVADLPHGVREMFYEPDDVYARASRSGRNPE